MCHDYFESQKGGPCYQVAVRKVTTVILWPPNKVIDTIFYFESRKDQRNKVAT